MCILVEATTVEQFWEVTSNKQRQQFLTGLCICPQLSFIKFIDLPQHIRISLRSWWLVNKK